MRMVSTSSRISTSFTLGVTTENITDFSVASRPSVLSTSLLAVPRPRAVNTTGAPNAR